MGKGKAPAMQFYIKDWLSDSQLQMADVVCRGIWINILCYMWDAPKRGELETTTNEISRIAGCMISESEHFIDESKRLGFCDIVTKANGIVTLRNRRMYREDNKRKNGRLRQEAYREKHKNNNEVTPLSSTSSPPPTPKEEKNRRFSPPDLEDIKSYCLQRKNKIDPEYFMDYQIARDWFLSNGKKMKCWKATIRTWEKNNYGKTNGGNNGKVNGFTEARKSGETDWES